MKVSTAPIGFLSGASWCLPASTRIHEWASIAADLEIGENCRIDPFSVITGKVKIGNRVHIGAGAMIFGGEGVEIGDGSTLSPGAKVFTATDDIRSDCLASPQLLARAGKYGPVKIGAFTVIGSGAVILPGAVIGDEVQIGSNAVIRGVVPSNEVWAGVPARFIRPRAKVDRGKALGLEIPPGTGA